MVDSEMTNPYFYAEASNRTMRDSRGVRRIRPEPAVIHHFFVSTIANLKTCLANQL